MDNASKQPRPFFELLDPTPATLSPASSGSMMGHSAPNPALSLQPHAYYMHRGGNADAGLALLDPPSTFPCLSPRCDAPPFADPDALDQHYKQVHVPMWATPHSTTQNHDRTPSTNQDRPAVLNVHYTLPSQSDTTTYDASRYIFAKDASTGKYRCPNCGVLASRMPDMERHMKKHEPESKGFDCLVCHRHGEHGFARKDKLKDHLRQKHRLLM